MSSVEVSSKRVKDSFERYKKELQSAKININNLRRKLEHIPVATFLGRFDTELNSNAYIRCFPVFGKFHHGLLLQAQEDYNLGDILTSYDISLLKNTEERVLAGMLEDILSVGCGNVYLTAPELRFVNKWEVLQVGKV